MHRWTVALVALLGACGSSEPAEAPAEEEAAEEVKIEEFPCPTPSPLFPVPEEIEAGPDGLFPAWKASACRKSKMPKLEDWPVHPTRETREQWCGSIDVDGDGKAEDNIHLSHKTEAGMGGTWGNLYESTTELWFGLHWEFSELTTFDANPVPEDVFKEEFQLSRALIEDAAFPRTCPTPDPMARWLTRTEPAMEWYAGSPAKPPDYLAVYVPNQQWVWMKGSKFSSFKAGASEGNYTLYTSNHAVAVKDTARDAWAVVWVYKGGTRSLDKSALHSARFEDANTVHLSVAGMFGDTPETVRYDLRTGEKVTD